MRSADHAMRETADDENRRKRNYHVTAESIGRHLVMAELLGRQFEAELAGAVTRSVTCLFGCATRCRNPFA